MKTTLEAPPTRGRALRGLVCLAAASLAMSGCSLSRLQFTNDHRLDFAAPSARAEVSVPVTIRWTMRDFEAAGLDGSTSADRGAYVVFLDQAPMPVGADLSWVARHDDDCARRPGCPSKAYLARQGVFVTTSRSVTLKTLPPVPDGVGEEEHYVTVVLVDGEGRRRRESSWYLPFQSARRSS